MGCYVQMRCGLQCCGQLWCTVGGCQGVFFPWQIKGQPGARRAWLHLPCCSLNEMWSVIHVDCKCNCYSSAASSENFYHDFCWGGGNPSFLYPPSSKTPFESLVICIKLVLNRL